MSFETYLKANWYDINAPLGKALGYPECCIKEFGNEPPELLQGKNPTEDQILRYNAGCIDEEFTGFIPCVNHAKEIESGKTTLKSLISNREEHFPAFPEYAQKSKKNKWPYFLLAAGLLLNLTWIFKRKQI